MNWKGAIVAGFLPRAVAQLGGDLTVLREAADLPPADVPAALFVIEQGLVAVNRIVGVVMTEIEPLTTPMRLVYRSTGGDEYGLCTDMDIGGASEGSLLTISGRPNESCVNSLVSADQEVSLLMGPGTIDLVCHATATGQVRWLLSYETLDPGSTVSPVPPESGSPSEETPPEEDPDVEARQLPLTAVPLPVTDV